MEHKHIVAIRSSLKFLGQLSTNEESKKTISEALDAFNELIRGENNQLDTKEG